MRTKNLLKLAFTMMAMVVMTGAMAQVANSDYDKYSDDLQNPTEVSYYTLRTGGSTIIGLYAEPDPVYHGSYNEAGSWALTANFVWNWTASGGMAINKPATMPANYVEITLTGTTDYDITVAEQASAAYGNCVDASPTEFVARVIAPPTATITTADATDFCGNQAAQAINIRIVENIPDELATYAFAVQELVETIDENGNSISTISTNNTFVNFTMATKGVADGGAGWTAASPNFDYDFNSSALTLSGTNRTRYTYTLLKAADAPAAAAQGIISAITEKSDYVHVNRYSADYLTYAFTDNNVVFIVNPAPVTGPIYHIPNNYAF